jgi:hypothetical protein
MSQLYEIQKQLDSMTLQLSEVKPVSTQSAIADVTNSIISTPDATYTTNTLNAINETITTVNSIVIQLNLVLSALRNTQIIGK